VSIPLPCAKNPSYVTALSEYSLRIILATGTGYSVKLRIETKTPYLFPLHCNFTNEALVIQSCQSDPDVTPLFVHQNLWLCIESGGKCRCYITGNFCSQTYMVAKFTVALCRGLTVLYILSGWMKLYYQILSLVKFGLIAWFRLCFAFIYYLFIYFQ
jgi:hypothetical protein